MLLQSSIVLCPSLKSPLEIKEAVRLYILKPRQHGATVSKNFSKSSSILVSSKESKPSAISNSSVIFSNSNEKEKL